MTKMTFYDDTVTGACGMGVLSGFSSPTKWYPGKEISDATTGSGTGMFCAGFVTGNEVCDTMYKELSAKFPVLWKSEERLNRNSGNMFYFVVFDAGDPGPSLDDEQDDDWNDDDN